MHRLRFVRIQNFRSCQDVSIDLETFTPIVGPNNCGKSTMLSALAWMMKPEALDRSDFNDDTKPVVVEVIVVGLTDGILNLLTPEQKAKMQSFINNGELRARRTSKEPGTSAARTVVDVRDPAEMDDTSEYAWKIQPTGFWNAITALFPEPILIGAMEDAAEDASKSKNTTTLGKLIVELSQSVIGEASAGYSAAAKEIADRVSAAGQNRSPALASFDAEASRAIAEFFPGISVRLHIPVPELKDLVKAGTIMAYDSDNERSFSSLGHGAQRSIQMALVRVLADRKQSENTATTTRLLLIDEPELYLHPAAVHLLRDSLKALAAKGFQVVVATHSPIFVEAGNAASAVIVSKDPVAGTLARKTLRRIVQQEVDGSPHQAAALFSLSNASEVLFADRVILAEGKTEKRLLPILYEHVHGRTLRSGRVALVDLGGVESIPKARAILDALGLPSLAIVDLDFAFRGAVSLGWISPTDPGFSACLAEFRRIASSIGGCLDANGLPISQGAIKAVAMYEQLARSPLCVGAIDAFAQALLAKRIWIWKLGTIESHLGLKGKSESSWAHFAGELDTKGLSGAVADATGVGEMLRWIG